MTGPFVLDASLAAAWIFPDEVTPATTALRPRGEQDHLLVPAIFPVEVQNILRTAEIRGRLTAQQAEDAWKKLLRIDIRVQPAAAIQPPPELLILARQFSLSAYDASYPALAPATSLPVGTLDAKLRLSAAVLRIEVLP